LFFGLLLFSSNVTSAEQPPDVFSNLAKALDFDVGGSPFDLVSKRDFLQSC
jgi:hypothetical protein